MFPINFNFPYRKKDGSIITMEKALDGAGADLDLIDLDDVAISTPADGDGLIYDNTAQKWKNIPIISRIIALFNAWKRNGAYNLYNHNLQTQEVSTGDGTSVTVTVNRTVGSADYGTFTIVGTVGSATDITVGALDPNVFKVGQKYKLTGCPNGGGATTYNIRVTGAGVEDHGDGVEFTATGSDQMKIQLRGASINATFKPMITTDLNATYADYVPYAKTNRELTEFVNKSELGSNGIQSTNITSIVVKEGTYTLSGSGVISAKKVASLGDRDLIAVTLGQLGVNVSSISGEVGGSIAFNNTTTIALINSILSKSYTQAVACFGSKKVSYRNLDNKRVSATYVVGRDYNYLWLYMPDGATSFNMDFEQLFVCY